MKCIGLGKKQWTFLLQLGMGPIPALAMSSCR